MRTDLGIIGFGRFGRLLGRELRGDFRVLACDVRRFSLPGVRRVSLSEAAGCRIVVLALPAGKLRGLLPRIAPHVAPGALVLDVCAVKEEPLRWMREFLPRSADVVGLHPLFGPDSARAGVAGHTVVLCPVRIGRARLGRLTRYFRSKGLVVRRTTPAAHDRAMASTLFVTQFIGRALAGLLPSESPLVTPNARLLRQIIRASVADSPELFGDIYRHNRFARTLAPSVVRRCRNLLLTLSK